MEFSGKSDKMQTDQQLKVLYETIQSEMMMKLITIMTDKCYTKCVTKPGSALDSSQKKCLSNCVDRFIETEEMTQKIFQTRLMQEVGQGQ